jgi:hypothetical protein
MLRECRRVLTRRPDVLSRRRICRSPARTPACVLPLLLVLLIAFKTFRLLAGMRRDC